MRRIVNAHWAIMARVALISSCVCACASDPAGDDNIGNGMGGTAGTSGMIAVTGGAT